MNMTLTVRPPFTLVKSDPLTIKGHFKYGLKIKDVSQKEFVLREASTDDLFAAEGDASAVQTPLTYEGALAARQLVSVGTYDGPVSLGMLRTLKPLDFALLRAAQGELDRLLGEE